jgi:hypothetical protein
MVSRRRSREAGHRRKFLAVIDDTPECERAMRYAGMRAHNSGGGLVLVYVIEPGDFQHWLGVEEIMRAEAMEEAEATLAKASEKMRQLIGIDPEVVIRQGRPPKKSMRRSRKIRISPFWCWPPGRPRTVRARWWPRLPDVARPSRFPSP